MVISPDSAAQTHVYRSEPLPQVRQLDDLSPKPGPQDAVDLKGRAAAKKLRKEIFETLSDDIQEFSRQITAYCERIREASFELKNDRKMTERRTVANLRGAAKCDTRLNGLGEVIRNIADGHAELGINQGWSIQAIHTAASYIYRNVYELAARPYTLRMRGEKPDSERLTKVFTFVLDDLLKKAQHEQAGHIESRLIPRYGTVEWRYEMTRPVYMVRDSKTLAWIEHIAEPTPKITVWDGRLVFVSDPGKPAATDQRIVFWMTEGCTIKDVECEEAVFDFKKPKAEVLDPMTGLPVPPAVDEVNMYQPESLAVVGGKYTGVELLRFHGKSGGSAPEQGDSPQDITARAGFERKLVNYFKPFTLIEAEGAMPMSMFTGEYDAQLGRGSGPLTPDVAAWFGIDVGFMPEPDDEIGFIEWTRRLDKIPAYRIAYAAENDSTGSMQANVICMLQCEPDRHRTPRNTLYCAKYMPDGMEFYGMGVVDLGQRLENAGDLERNAQIWGDWYNAYPGHLVDSRVVRSRKLADVMKLLKMPDAVIEKAPGMDLTQAVQTFTREINPRVEQTIAAIKNEFENTTGVSATAKGQAGPTSSDTLGEIEINEAKSQVALNDLILSYCRELIRMYRHMISDIVYFMGRAGFIAYAARVSGVDAAELDRLLPENLDGIENEFNIQHPLSATQDTMQLATLMMRLFQLVGVQGFPDVQKFASTVLEMAGYVRSDSLTQTEHSMAPADEHIQMEQGNWVQPKTIDDHVQHLTEHGALLEALQPEANIPIPGMTPEARQNITRLLGQHIMEHIKVMQMQAEVAGLLAGPQQGAALGQERGILDGQGGPEGGGGGNSNVGNNTQQGTQTDSYMDQDTAPGGGSTPGSVGLS